MKHIVKVAISLVMLAIGTAQAGPKNPYGYAGGYYGYPGGHHHGLTRVHGYYNGHNHASEWLVPMIVGGVLVYVLTQPRNTPAQPQQQVYTGPGNATPVYQYQNIYDEACSCTRRVLVQIN